MGFFIDTRSIFTILPPDEYMTSMRKVVAADTILRVWGARKPLDMKGMVVTELVTDNGARKRTKIYILGSHKPEALLGEEDAEDLGFIKYYPDGREPTKEEQSIEGDGGRIMKLETR